MTLDDVESAVKAALTFLRNASSQCTTLRRGNILEEYNKDLISFNQESEDLFDSAKGTLFGPSFAEKATEHLKQIQTLQRTKGGNGKGNQGFSKAPRITLSGGQVLHAPATSRQLPAIPQRSAKERSTAPKEMTRTVQCTHSLYNNRRMCKSYD